MRSYCRRMRWLVLAVAVATCVAGLWSPAAARPSPAALRIAFVPLDDRPATSLFPAEIAAICGVDLQSPPASMLGHFEQPGDTDAIGRWLLALDARGLSALVVSTDMIAYGGLVASREPATSLSEATGRLGVLTRFHAAHPDVPIYAFGSVMRLAPTVQPASEAYQAALTDYAQNAAAVAPSPEVAAALAADRAVIPPQVLAQYLQTRARDADADAALLDMVDRRDIALFALTQDDAGSPDGLQVAEERRLHDIVERLKIGDRTMLNPGTDEMGLAMVMRAVEDAVGWAPSVRIAYPSAASAAASDPLEYLPIQETVAHLTALLRMAQRTDADFELAVNAPAPAHDRETFAAAIGDALESGAQVAVADLSFASTDESLQPLLAQSMELRGVAGSALAFATWNTTANTTGTALAEAAATLVGRHFGTLSDDAAASFLFDRYVDDYGYRLLVRPALQARLLADGDDIFSLGDRAPAAESLARSMLRPIALSIFARDFTPRGDTLSDLTIDLPWQRTFEARIQSTVKTHRSAGGM